MPDDRFGLAENPPVSRSKKIFFLMTESGITYAMARSFLRSQRSMAATLPEYIILLSALSICAVFAANPRAIPRSVIRIMQGKAEEIRMPVLLCSACLCNHCTTRITSRTSFDPGNGVSFCSDQNAGPRALTFFPSREKNSMLLSPPDCVRLVASLTSPLSGSTQRMIVSTPHLFGTVRAAGAIRPAIVFNAALLYSSKPFGDVR